MTEDGTTQGLQVDVKTKQIFKLKSMAANDDAMQKHVFDRIGVEKPKRDAILDHSSTPMTPENFEPGASADKLTRNRDDILMSASETSRYSESQFSNEYPVMREKLNWRHQNTFKRMGP